MSTLEDRYRRLLGLYPAEHRRLFGDEMLGVLMSTAGDGQRRPRPGESIDLMWHALWRRLGGLRQPHTPGHWSLAAAVVGVVGPLWLFALHLQQLYSSEGWRSPYEWELVAVALTLALTVLFGRRWLVIPMAWALAAAEVYLTVAAPALVLALTTAVALSVRQPARGGLRSLGGRGVIALAAIALLAGGGAAIDWLISVEPAVGEYVVFALRPYMTFVFAAVAAIAGLRVLWRRLDPPVRRRVLVLLLPSGIMSLLGLQFGYHRPIFAVWIELLLIVALIAVCALVLNRWERLMHLAELGRRAEADARQED